MFTQTVLSLEPSASIDILPCSKSLLDAASKIKETSHSESCSEDESSSSFLRELSNQIDAFIEQDLSHQIDAFIEHKISTIASAYGSLEKSRADSVTPRVVDDVSSVVTSFSESLPLEKMMRNSVTSRLLAKRKAKRAAVDDAASVISSFSESLPLEKISSRKHRRAPSTQTKPDSQKWVSTEFAAVMSARMGLNVKCSTQNAEDPPNLQIPFNAAEEWQCSEEVASSNSISSPLKLNPPKLPALTKKDPLAIEERFAMKGLTDPVRDQSFYINGTMRNHLLADEEITGRVPILEIVSQRHILQKQQLVLEEVNDSISRFGNASVLLMNTHPTHFFISGTASDLSNIGQLLCKGFSIPSFGMFTVKCVDIFLYTPEAINKLVNDSLEENLSTVVDGISPPDSERTFKPLPSSRLSSMSHDLPIYQMKSQDPLPENVVSDTPMFLSNPRASPMSSASSANVTFDRASVTPRRPMKLKSYVINASKAEFPLLQTFHCLNQRSENLLQMRPALFFITKLSTDDTSLVDLAKILVATKPNLEGGFSMELVQSHDDTKTAIIYATEECEPYLRGIYGDTDSTLWFDVERDTLAKLFGHYPQWWMDFRTTEHESTEYFVQCYFSSEFSTTPF